MEGERLRASAEKREEEVRWWTDGAFAAVGCRKVRGGRESVRMLKREKRTREGMQGKGEGKKRGDNDENWRRAVRTRGTTARRARGTAGDARDVCEKEMVQSRPKTRKKRKIRGCCKGLRKGDVEMRDV